MKRFLHGTPIAIGAALLAAACASPEAAVSERKDMLTVVGFVPKKADNPARIATLKSLPSHQFVAQTINDRPAYLYADPTVCGCVYVGDQNSYDRYRQQMAVRQTARDDQIRAILSPAPLPGESGL
jgi:hypothetical protein